MSDENRIIIYQDARGNVTVREVTNISESEKYIQGICLKAGELRTFRKDRVLEDVTNDLTNIDKKLEKYIAESVATLASSRSNPFGNPEICFTGFMKADKDKLIQLAKSHGMFIRTTVTQNLEFLCCGNNAGPKKIEKSRHQGVVVLSETQFKEMLTTGEIPEEA